MVNYSALMQKKPRGRPPGPSSLRIRVKVLGLGERYFYYARELQRSGRDDLKKAVERGEMKLSAAIRELRGERLPDRYDKLVMAWNRCSDEERDRFFEALTNGWRRPS
jgi:hypothetical protein